MRDDNRKHNASPCSTTLSRGEKRGRKLHQSGTWKAYELLDWQSNTITHIPPR